MRICIVHNAYARPSGEEYAVRNIADRLCSYGHEVVWFARDSADVAGTLTGHVHAFLAGIYSFSARRQMTRMLRSERVDIVQVQNLFPLISPSVLQACKQEGVPVVMRCPNYRLLCPNGLHLSNAEVCERCLGNGREIWCVLRNCEHSLPKSIGYALRNAVARITGMIRDNVDVFIVLSEFQKQRFIAAGIEAEKIEVLSNLIPDSPGSAPGIDGVGRTASFVGRLSPEKGLAVFLRAAKKMPGHPFAVAGDTTGASQSLGHAPRNVIFRGFLSGEDLEQFFARTRVLVFPSLWFEGFPNVIGKAMVAGKPVVCSRIGGLPEIVEDGKTGLLFEPGNAEELAVKLKHLWERPALCRRMGAAGREKALREYSPESYYERLTGVYEKAIHSAHGERRNNAQG